MRRLVAGMLLALSTGCVVLLPTSAFAALTIEITQGEDSGTPIAAVPFRWHGDGEPPEDIRAIIAADLHRSGRFDLLPAADFLSKPSEITEVRYKDWRLIKAEALVIGRVIEKGLDQFEVSFQLLDVYREKLKFSLRFSVKAAQFRQIGRASCRERV